MTDTCDSVLEKWVSTGPVPRYPHHLVRDWRLGDGTPVRIRPITGADRHRHWRFVCSLSLQTRYHRLMSARGLLPGELRRMVDIDYEREMALVAVAEVGDEEQELGVARYVREDAGDDRGNHAGDGAEFAIVVADAWQHRGIGGELLRSLQEAAATAGVSQLGGLTLATNARMIRLARRLGFAVSHEPDDWTLRRIVWRQGQDSAVPSSAVRSLAAQSATAHSGTAQSGTAC